MTRIRTAFAGIALGSVVLVAAIPVHAGNRKPVAPPPELAQYIADVRKADLIENDEARCKAYPDLPDNLWRPGAAQGRCTILRAPAWSLDEIDRLLATPDGVAELERGFAALLDGHYNDQSQREQIFVSLNVFDGSARAGEISQRWLKLSPKSAFALTAAGIHLGTSGWNARGSAFMRETPEENVRRMGELFAQAVPLYVKALEIEPRLSVACYKLNGIGRSSSSQLEQYARAHCMKVDPDSYYLAWEWITSAEPRWGGSEDALRRAVAYAAARTERNPILGALLGEGAGERPSMADDYGTVVDELAAAARMGPSASLTSMTGSGYWSKDDPWPAVVYYSQATRFLPREAKYRYARAAILNDYLHDVAWARSDMLVAVELEPDNPKFNYMLGLATEEVIGQKEARPHYKRAMTGDWRQRAMQRNCQTYFVPQIQDGALNCSLGLVDEFPQSGDAWQLRAWALVMTDDPAAPEAIKRFEAVATTDDHRHDLAQMKSRFRPQGTAKSGK
jgi:tetratricopeptide (TPR) repeat protein